MSLNNNNTIINDPAALASKFINHTNKNIFLTGKAGTGKTTFLKHIIQHTHKKAAIVAPTGIAAINAGGVTIHSMFQLPFGSYIPVKQNTTTVNPTLKFNDAATLIRTMQMNETKRKLLRELELLIVDEVSMLRADLLDAIDAVLRHLRRKPHIAFGGLQLLFIGDLLQLPPVIKEEEWQVLKAFYKSAYFFDALALQQEKPIYIELEKIYRQADDTFISVLNNLRNNEVTSNDVALLNTYYKPNYTPSASENYITLTTHNYKADKLNNQFLQELKTPSYFFDAELVGEFNEGACPVEKRLELKKGAQIMFVKNDTTGAQRFFNGKIAVVADITRDSIFVQLNDSEKTLELEKHQWENIRYTLNETTNEVEEKIIGTFTQYPIKLAWAITVHKSQGLTFDKAIVDIGDAFAPGQVYVALSRLRTLDGLILSSPVNYNIISKDSKVAEYAKVKNEQQNPEELVKEEEILFLKNYLLQCFDFTALTYKLSEHVDSYVKDEKRSAKQKFQSWAKELKEELVVIKPHADKFMHQINQIMDKKDADHIASIGNRVKSAHEYFVPFFKKISKQILKQIEIVKTEKQIKYYVEELLDLELSFYEQQKQLYKATALCNAMLDNAELSKKDISRFLNEQDRFDSISRALQIPIGEPKIRTEKKEKRERKPRERKSAVKKEKKDTKEETFQLFQQGKTMAEVAAARGMAVSTIEGHLAYYIIKGSLDAKQLVDEKKLKQIIVTSKELNTVQLGPIKQALGDDYSYADIRFALASTFTEKN